MSAIDIILRLLDLLVAGTAAYERIAAIQAQLTLMKAEGREPTDAEWEALFDRIASYSDRLDQADKRLNP